MKNKININHLLIKFFDTLFNLSLWLCIYIFSYLIVILFFLFNYQFYIEFFKNNLFYFDSFVVCALFLSFLYLFIQPRIHYFLSSYSIINNKVVLKDSKQLIIDILKSNNIDNFLIYVYQILSHENVSEIILFSEKLKTQIQGNNFKHLLDTATINKKQFKKIQKALLIYEQYLTDEEKQNSLFKEIKTKFS